MFTLDNFYRLINLIADVLFIGAIIGCALSVIFICESASDIAIVLFVSGLLIYLDLLFSHKIEEKIKEFDSEE